MQIEIKPDPGFKKKSTLGAIVVAVLSIIFVEIIHLIVYSTEGPEINWLFFCFNGIIILSFFGLGLPLRFWYINNLKYNISSERITIYKGILSKIEINIPFKMITDFKLIRSPFDRIFGIASILAQTAGAGSQIPEGMMKGIKDYETLFEGLKQRLADYESRRDIPEGTEREKDISDLYEELVKIRELLEK